MILTYELFLLLLLSSVLFLKEMESNIDVSKVPSTIQEYFTVEEFAKIPEYERLHLQSLRQNYEVLRNFGKK